MFFPNIKEIDALELSRWIADDGKDFRLIDVREPNELVYGTIPGADAIPLSRLGNRLGEVEQDKPVVFVCRSGARSGQVCAYLAQQGFEQVYNLRGGVIGWAQQGFGFEPVAQIA